MDVNKPEGVQPVGDQPHRQPQKRHDQESEDPRDDGRNTWSSEAAVDLDGLLADGGVTPEVQKILDGIAAQIEPMRAELERVKAREAGYREIAVQHSYLPMPDRREFLRELTHVIDHMDSLSPPPALLVVHVPGIGDIRRKYGRQAADLALTHAAVAITSSVHPTDAVGSLSGEDFGVVLLSGGGETARRRVADIRQWLSEKPFKWQESETPLGIQAGLTVLRDDWSSARAVEAADRHLLSGGVSAS